MPAYNFKKRFAPHIRSGRKTHTIRDKRKRRTKPGEMCYLFCGMRTSQCERLLNSPCTKVQDIEIFEDLSVYIDGERLSPDECEQLAYRDGFDSFAEMISFWDGRLPFLEGELIHWRPETKTA